MKRVLILGSTGSIGCQTLDAIAGLPDQFQVIGLVAGSNVDRLLEQGREWNVTTLGIADETCGNVLHREASGVRTAVGQDEICDLVTTLHPDLVIGAISGVAGLKSLLTALHAGIDVALANKEPLVAAGGLVTSAARASGARLLPIDSEISAVFQCLEGRPREHLHKVLLTASGGAFRDLPPGHLASVTPQMALAHPTWKMGKKITVDCATLANKGFEVHELHWMFDVPFNKIEVVIHHQSIIHSLIELVDGSVIGQFGPADMRFAIQYALTWPNRLPNDFPKLNLAQIGQLSFAQPDMGRYPMLRMAYEAGASGASYPATLNAANEAAVELFLAGHISFPAIAEVVERVLEAHNPVKIDSLQTVSEVDAKARMAVSELSK